MKLSLADEPIFDISKADNPASLAKPREIEESNDDENRDKAQAQSFGGEADDQANRKSSAIKEDSQVAVARSKESASSRELNGEELLNGADPEAAKEIGRENGDTEDRLIDPVPLFRISNREFQEMMDSLRSLYERHTRSENICIGQGNAAFVDILDEVLQCFDLHSGTSDLSIPRHSVWGTLDQSNRGSAMPSSQLQSFDKDGMVDPEKDGIAKDAQLTALLQENSRLIQLLRAQENEDQARETKLSIKKEPVDYFDDIETFTNLLDADLQTIADKYLANFELEV